MVVDSFGTIARPMSRAQIIAKGAGLAQLGNFPSGEALAATIWDEASGAQALAAQLSGVPRA